MNAMIKPQDYLKLPLVYSCSGFSSATQTENNIAIKLDREEKADISFISGVGGNAQHLVNIARSGPPIFSHLMTVR